MEFSERQKRNREIRDRHAISNRIAGRPEWGAAECVHGCFGNPGALSTFVTARDGFRDQADLENRIAHELADCRLSVIIMADELSVDIEAASFETMDDLDARLGSTEDTTPTKDES